MKVYVVRSKDDGAILSEEFATRQDAEAKMKYFEYLDKMNGIYEECSYEIAHRNTSDSMMTEDDELIQTSVCNDYIFMNTLM